MSSEYVVAKDLDQTQIHDTAAAAARNKRKMTRPKRMLPSSSSASTESNHRQREHEEDQVGVVLEEEQHSNGPWNLGDVTAQQLMTSGGQPLDLRSSPAEPPCCDAVGMEELMWFPSNASPTETSSVETNEAVEGQNHTRSATQLNCDPVSTETEYGTDPVAMDTGSLSGHGVALETVVSGDVMRGVGKGYKHMSRQRRIEANARERSRVHTISAAFESLRRAVPSYAYNQRLSKLAILRIACSYIVALARLADLDYSRAQDAMDFGECVDLCTRTLQAEGRAKRRQ